MTGEIGAVLLAGGGGRRMGRDKRFLLLGGQTFLERIGGELSGFPERILSVGVREDLALDGFAAVQDRYADCGPLGGLHAALSVCRSPYLLAVSCDLPLFRRELGEYLAGYLSPDADAVVAVARDGRPHPLCGIYHKRCVPVLRRQLEIGRYRVMDALRLLNVRRGPLQHSVFPCETLSNINTPEQYRQLRRKLEGPPVIAVCGAKNVGKTTLIAGILPHLRERGCRVAVIKHDGHGFVPDVPGTDSFRFREAGASGVAVYSPRRYMVTASRQQADPAFCAEFFPDADLILLEGGKHSDYPKIEVARSDAPRILCSDAAGRIGVCSAQGLTTEPPSPSISGYPAIADFILRYIGWPL